MQQFKNAIIFTEDREAGLKKSLQTLKFFSLSDEESAILCGGKAISKFDVLVMGGEWT
ncbi:MAG: hypothetical protein V7K88_20470 [Nostoc sp.]|uniref:hypothetical protein n=1 Tax=Nostoc sp. TaxID=1180 RepID=UPI002FF7BC76